MVGVSSGKGGILSTLSTGIGNYSVSYNFNSIAIALIVMSASVCTSDDSNCRDGEQAKWVASSESAVVFVGAICGQLTMGYAGDVFGRGLALALTLAIACVGALFSSILPMGSAFSIYLTIIFCRFLLGVGVGGVYPLSAAKAAEDFGTSDKVNVTAAGWTFMWQIPGTFSPWLVAIFFSYSDDMSAQQMWRLLLGLGSIPAGLVVVLLLLELQQAKNSSTLETAIVHSAGLSDYVEDKPRGSVLTLPGQTSGSRHDSQDSVGHSPAVSLWTTLRNPAIQRKLFVTGGCWFIYDVCTYGVLLFSGEIVSKMLPSTDDVSSPEQFRDVAKLQVIASVCAIPASVLTVFALKTYSVKNVQIIGFFMIFLTFLLLIIAMNEIHSSAGVFVFYVLLSCALTGGASMTTFVLPAVVYNASVRTTLNGISAAMGKLGAVVGAYLFGALATATSFSVVMGICCVLALVAMAITYLFVEEGATDPMRMTDALLSGDQARSVSMSVDVERQQPPRLPSTRQEL